MIVTNREGRNRSEKTLKERRLAVEKIWGSLSEVEREIAMKVLDEWDFVLGQGEGGGFEDLDDLKRASPVTQRYSDCLYSGSIVSAKDFFLDDYYMGRAGKSLYPVWLEDLISYNEVIITGSIGGGKTTFVNMGLIREFFLLCMLKDPQLSFGLMPGTEIVLVCFNRDKKLAREVTFGGVARLIESSPYFQGLNLKMGSADLVYPAKNIRIISASVRSSDALGRNIYGGIIDETDFLQGSSLVGSGLGVPGVKSFAEQLHSSILGRMKSRYVRDGVLAGKLFMSSSARHKSSFTNKRISESKNDPNVFVRDYALYQAQPVDRFKKERFWVLVGNERTRHRMLTDEEYAAYDEEDIAELKEKGCKFLHVPEDFRSDFDSNIEKSVQDIGGVVTPSMTRYIQLSERIHEAVDPTLFHPMDTVSLVTGEDPGVWWDRLVVRRRHKLSPGVYENVIEPRRHPLAARHVHIDLSRGVTDPAGICIAHTVDMIGVERRLLGGKSILEEAPLIEVDLLLQVLPPRDGEIDFGSIRSLVYAFRNHGYSIQFVSLDSWNAVDSLQKFRAQGMKAEVVSTWKTTAPYDYMKTALYEGRLSYYDYPVLVGELEQLEKNEAIQKIDHPSGGCFIGDTMVRLWNGMMIRIEDLDGMEVEVCSVSGDGGIVAGVARGRKTKETSELVDVVLSGRVVRCTPEHLWMLWNGEYKEASSLVPGVDRLMSFGGSRVVMDVAHVNCGVPVPVYDLEVDGHHNFALECGVFVHNSKDVADSLAGVVFTLSTQVTGRSFIGLGISEYESHEKDSEWLRSTMVRKGEKGPIPVTPRGGDDTGGPLIISG